MGKKRKELSHEEIWDDSGLVRAWDEAYAEYKKYHSIAARGEKVEDVLAAEATADGGSGGPEPGEQGAAGREIADSADEGEIDEGEIDEGEGVPDAMNVEAAEVNGLQEDVAAPADQNGPSGVPQAMTEKSSSDPALKNLMMSWYWAGYYSGFYEGQRQGSVAADGPASKQQH